MTLSREYLMIIINLRVDNILSYILWLLSYLLSLSIWTAKALDIIPGTNATVGRVKKPNNALKNRININYPYMHKVHPVYSNDWYVK